MNIRYPAIIEHQDEGGFTVSFPDIDEAITEGDSLEAALFNATDVLTLTIESRIDEGMNIPMPSSIGNAYEVAPSSKIQAALLEIYQVIHYPSIPQWPPG